MPTSLLDSYTVPTTDLQAVNFILGGVGEHPISSLIDPGVPAQGAITRLGEVNVEFQSEGWSFNTDDNLTLDPSDAGEIVLPAGTLLVRQGRILLPVTSGGGSGTPPTGPALVMLPGSKRSRLVVRGGKLYDRVMHTFNIGAPVCVDLTTCLAFEDMPQQARWYVTLKATRRYAANKLVSGNVYGITAADEAEARLRFEQAEDIAEELDQMDGNPHIQFMRAK